MRRRGEAEAARGASSSCGSEGGSSSAIALHGGTGTDAGAEGGRAAGSASPMQLLSAVVDMAQSRGSSGSGGGESSSGDVPASESSGGSSSGAAVAIAPVPRRSPAPLRHFPAHALGHLAARAAAEDVEGAALPPPAGGRVAGSAGGGRPMAGAVQQQAARVDTGPPLRPRAGDDSGKSGGGSVSGSGSGSDAQGGDSNSGGNGSGPGPGAPGTAPGGGGGGASTEEGDYVDDGGDYDDMMDLAGMQQQQHGMHSAGTVGVPDTYGANSGAGSRALPASAIVLLRTWMLSHEHFSHPYPSDAEKEELALACGISVRQVREGRGRRPRAPQPLLRPRLLPRQVSVWFTNARKRIWVPLRARAARGERISLVIAGRLGCPPPSSLVPYPPHAMPLIAAQSRVQHAPPFLGRQVAPLRMPAAMPLLAAGHAVPPAQHSGTGSIDTCAGAAAEAEARGRRADAAADSSGGSARRETDTRSGAAGAAMQCDDGGGGVAAAPAGHNALAPPEQQQQQRVPAKPPADAAVTPGSAVAAAVAAPAQPVPLVFPFPAATATPSYVMSLLQGVDAPTALSRIGAVARAIAAARADLQVRVGGCVDAQSTQQQRSHCARGPILSPPLQAKLAVLDENAAGVEEAQRRLVPRADPMQQRPQHQRAQLAPPPAPTETRLCSDFDGGAADADMQGDAPQLLLPEGQPQQQRQRLHILHGEDEALSPDAGGGSILKMPG